MQCPQESMLIRLVAGELDAQSTEQIEQHVADCAVCASGLEAIRFTWIALDAYTDECSVDVDASLAAGPSESAVGDTIDDGVGDNIELWPAVRDGVRRDVRARAFWFPRTPAGLLRIAASVALSVGLGWATGAWIMPNGTGMPNGSGLANNSGAGDQGLGDSADEAAIARALQPLGIDEFVTGSATGLELAFVSTADSES